MLSRMRALLRRITLTGICLPSIAGLRAMPAENPQFASLTEEFVYQSLAFSPVTATAQGLHQRRVGGRLVTFDTEIDDYSAAGIQKQIQFYSDVKRRLAGFNPADLSPEQMIDYRLMADVCDATLLDWERIQAYRHNPTVYVELIGNALFGPLMLDYAPEKVRVGHMLARMEKLPRLVQQAKENLQTTDPIYTKVALEENQGNFGMIEKDIARMAEAASAHKQRYAAAAPAALAALRDLSAFIRDVLPKRGARSWRLGRELYDLKFRYGLQTDLAPDELLKTAEDRIPVIYDRMYALSLPIHEQELHHQEHAEIADLRARQLHTIREVLALIAREHTTGDKLMAEAQKDLDESISFIRAKQILTLAGENNLRIIPTPVFMRGAYGVGGLESAPLLEPRLEAFFWITPIPPDWTPQQVESKLREDNFYKFKLFTMHEAVPGHYTQSEYASRLKPEPRRLLRGQFGNGPYVEGWAEYAEETMLQEGFMDHNPKLEITFLKEELRCLGNVILDMRMHRADMTDEAAMDLVENRTFQEHSEAVGKLQRAKLSSAQLCYYYLGWTEFRNLRRKTQAQQGSAFNLAAFHNKILSEGAIPVREFYRLLGVRP